MKNKTVVEWLFEELQGIHPSQIEYLQTFEQAKVIEKQQHQQTAIYFYPSALKRINFEQYYKMITIVVNI
jgi:hypothetical protein